MAHPICFNVTIRRKRIHFFFIKEWRLQYPYEKANVSTRPFVKFFAHCLQFISCVYLSEFFFPKRLGIELCYFFGFITLFRQKRIHGQQFFR